MLGPTERRLILASFRQSLVHLQSIVERHDDKAVKNAAYALQTKLENLVEELEIKA